MGRIAARQFWLVLAVTSLGIACGDAPGSESAGADALPGPAPEVVTDSGPARRVRPGIAVLLDDSLDLVRGRRIGLITNQTGVLASPPTSTIDILADRSDLELVALFGPEHGLRGKADPGASVSDARDPVTGLPVYSLYGGTRRPTPSSLEGLDVLVFDIQDIGARYYTYVWTMSLAMEAAGEAGIPFVVLDRPDPIGGTLVQGNVLDPSFGSFVGRFAVPMRPGLTPGEMARLLVGEFGLRVELHVVPVDGWRRDMSFDETGLRWVPPSPNMPSVASALHYPGTCLFEGTNLSVGRGTDRPFQQVGAPWLDGAALARALNERHLAGVRFEAVTFRPGSPADGKFDGEDVQGVRFVATDPAVYDPTRAAVAALVDARRLSADAWRWRPQHFDRLAGTDRLRVGIEAGLDADVLTAGWRDQLAAFDSLRAPYLIYP